MAGDRDVLEDILEKIRGARNFDFRNYKRATLQRRIERRMSERRCRSMSEYAELLDRAPEEYDALVSRMLIKVTSFFRDAETWDLIARKVLPPLIKKKQAGEELRIWSVGCATGEEAYSVAILVAEALGPAAATANVKVFGTDVDEAAVAMARRGIYPRAAVEDLPKDRLARWFTQVPEGWAVKKDIRRMVVFGVNNLVSDAPISRLDLLLCRNVFIYLDARLQKRVLSRFHYALRPDGVLVLGKSELIPFAANVFEPIDLQRRVYRRGSTNGRELLDEERLAGLLEQEDVSRAVRQTRDDLSALGQFHRELLDAVPYPVLATTVDGAVSFWNAAAARLWKRTAADVHGKRITALGLPGLAGDLLVEKTAQVREGKADRRSAEGTIDRGDGEPVTLSVDVTPLRDAGNEVVGLLYVGQDVTALRRMDETLRAAREERDRSVEDLRTATEEMQSSNEELETTNEELQSANEELQTTNEELQSANEELETTNEELQSTNAELDATNRELAHRTEELNFLSFHQRTIIRSLSAAVAVLDPQGRITVWNLAAERLLGLTEAEAVGQLLWTLRVPILARALMKEIRKKLLKQLALRVEDIQYERPGGGRGHAALSAVPLVEDQRALGSVIIVEDTTRAVLLAEERLREAAEKRERERRTGSRREKIS
ncbi:MAG TPA: CheR family methyltransferase [Anaeromyxobacteraceae bacterium]